MALRVRRAPQVGVAIGPSLLVLLIGVFMIVNARRAAATRAAIGRQIAVAETLDRMLDRITDAETAQRGYLITGEDRYLTPYSGARGDVRRGLAALRPVVADDSTQQSQLDTVAALAAAKFSEMDSTLALRKTAGFEAARTVVETDRGKATMDALRRIIGALIARENQVLRMREDAAERTRVITRTIILAAIVLAAFLALITNRYFARYAAAEASAARELEERALQLQEQAVELELQSNQLQQQAIELEAANEDLQEAVAVADRTRSALAAEGDRVRTLQRVTAGLATVLTRDEVAHVIASEGAAALGAQVGAVGVLTADGRAIDMVTNTPGVPAAAQRWHRFPNVPGLPYADVIAACEPLFITTRAEYEARFPALRDTLAATDLAASATLPMGVEGRVIGAISFDFAAEREFDADDRALLATLCRQCAQAIERARLYEAEHAARADAEMLRSDAEEARARAEDARRRADDANQAKSAFLATMSHELRTPLNAIGGYAELLDLGVRGPVTAAQHQDLARIRRAGAYLLGLINDVLNFVQLESAQVRYSVRDLSVNTALQDAAALIEPQTRQKGIHFVCEPCPHDWTMRADGDKVQQVLLNLLSNAVKFTLEGGQVVLSCLGREAPYGTPDGSVRIAVRDTGSGIPADKLEQIFEPFVQIGRELRNPVAGVGLGLAISRELARGMGGNLTADSTVGAGSTFTVVLPRPPDPLP